MALSGYSPEAEQKIERLLTSLYTELNIQKPDDLFGSICVEVRYQNGKPIGQVDVQLKYVMKRNDGERKEDGVRRRSAESVQTGRRRRIIR